MAGGSFVPAPAGPASAGASILPRAGGQCASLPRLTSMRLMTAHRILISAGALFFAGYALWELLGGSAQPSRFPRAGLALLGAVALGIYLRSVWRPR